MSVRYWYTRVKIAPARLGVNTAPFARLPNLQTHAVNEGLCSPIFKWHSFTNLAREEADVKQTRLMRYVFLYRRGCWCEKLCIFWILFDTARFGQVVDGCSLSILSVGDGCSTTLSDRPFQRWLFVLGEGNMFIISCPALKPVIYSDYGVSSGQQHGEIWWDYWGNIDTDTKSQGVTVHVHTVRHSYTCLHFPRRLTARVVYSTPLITYVEYYIVTKQDVYARALTLEPR